MIQQLFAEEQISSTERDHLKGKKNFSRQRLYISLNSKGLDFFKLKCLLPFLSKLLYMWPVFIIFNLWSRHDLRWRHEAFRSNETLFWTWRTRRATAISHTVCTHIDPRRQHGDLGVPHCKRHSSWRQWRRSSFWRKYKISTHKYLSHLIFLKPL